MRIAVWWSELPRYAAACIRALANRPDVKVAAGRYSRRSNKPYGKEDRKLPIRCETIREDEPRDRQWSTVSRQLETFEPDALVVPGWSIPVFNQTARWARQRGISVICLADNQWGGELRQWVGIAYARLVFLRRYSAMFVPGERARVLANYFGFKGRRLITGAYSADAGMFWSAYEERANEDDSNRLGSFLFVGSIIPRKGIETLFEAYRIYRERCDEPWGLRLAGEGQLSESYSEQPGVKLLGFAPPSNLPGLMKDSGAFILPSRMEGWSLAIHEAACAGLPIICTEQCGSNVELVRNEFNGYVVEAGDVSALVDAMTRVTQARQADLKKMSDRSFLLSQQYSPDLWATRLVEGINALPDWEDGSE